MFEEYGHAQTMLLIKDLTFVFLFVNTAAGVVLCGGPKSSPIHHP